MRLFVPEYGNYYHFITESVMGLYRTLRDHEKLHTKDCEIWYKGRYAEIIQLFSRDCIHSVENIKLIPTDVDTLIHIRPKNHEQWLELRSLRVYLEDMFPRHDTQQGITVIKRINKRVYTEHADLVRRLSKFDMPVREAIMETLPFEKQVDLLRNTRILVGPHGSGETNMMFMPTGSMILELYPKGFSDRVFRGMALAFGHHLVELEATRPSVIGRLPSQRVQEYLDHNPWPNREVFVNWKPDRMELGRVLRDVSSFSIDPNVVIERLEAMLKPLQ